MRREKRHEEAQEFGGPFGCAGDDLVDVLEPSEYLAPDGDRGLFAEP